MSAPTGCANVHVKRLRCKVGKHDIDLKAVCTADHGNATVCTYGVCAFHGGARS